MSRINERMKRMVVFAADKKQHLLLKNLKEPNFTFDSMKEIDSKFNEMCQKHSKQLFNFDAKQPQQPSVSASQAPLTTSLLKQKTHKLSLSNSMCSTSQTKVKFKDQQQGFPSSHMRTTTSIISNLKTDTSFTRQAKQSSMIRLTPVKTTTQTSKQLERIPAKAADLQKQTSPRNIRFTSKKQQQSTSQQSQQLNESQPKKEKVEKDKENESDIDEKISQSPEWIMIQNKLKSQINAKKSHSNYSSSDNFVNPLVKLFGNTFIAMVLQALVVKKIDDLFGVKINTESNIPISESLLKQFGISTAMINSLSSPSEKSQYIAETMSVRISVLIKDWDEKQKYRYEKLHDEITVQEKEDKRKEVMRSDMFEWLKVDTNHDMLKKKLRMAIIEKLTDFENQSEIALKMHGQPNLSNNPQNEAENRAIQLKNLQNVSTRVLLLRMDERENKYLKENLTPEQQLQYDETYHLDYLQENKKHIKRDGQTEEIKSQKHKELEQMPEWTEELERAFLNNKKQARVIYSEDINVSSWSKQGYLPLVQEYNLTNQKKMEREQLIQNYRDGCWMTEKELKFIADTSQLINECIDKDYVQQVVNQVDKQDVAKLELNLAESIISNYENMQQLIREQRLKFLEESYRLRQLDRVNQRYDELVEHRRKEELHQQRRYVRMFKTIGNRLLSTKRAFIFDTFKQNFFCRLFYEKMRSVLQAFRKKKAAEELPEFHNQNQRRNKQLANQQNFVSVLSQNKTSTRGFIKGHQLHPPSKIPLFHLHEDEILDEKRADLMNFMVQRYKMTISSKPEVRVKDSFTKFYTGGPIKETITSPQQFANEMKKLKLTPLQYAGIVRIQTLFRQRRMRKIILSLKEQDFSTKSYQYYEKLRSYTQSRMFQTITAKGTGTELLKKMLTVTNNKPNNTTDNIEVDTQCDQTKVNTNIISVQDESQFQQQTLKPLSQFQSQQQQLQLPKEAGPQAKSKNLSIWKIKKEDQPYLLSSSYRFKTASSERVSNDKETHLQNTAGSDDNYEGTDDKSISEDNMNTYHSMTADRKLSKMTDSNYEASEDDRQQDINIQDQMNENINLNFSTFNSKNGLSNFKNVSTQDNNNENNSLKIQIPEKYSTNNMKMSIQKEHECLSLQERIKRLEENRYDSSQRKHTQSTKLTATIWEKRRPVLLVKQIKLLECVKQDDLLALRASGLRFTSADIDCRDSQNNTPLYYAVNNQSITFVRWLLAKGSNITALCSHQTTPLHAAFQINNITIIRDLLSFKPNLNVLDGQGFHPIYYASMEAANEFQLQGAGVAHFLTKSMTADQTTADVTLQDEKGDTFGKDKQKQLLFQKNQEKQQNSINQGLTPATLVSYFKVEEKN